MTINIKITVEGTDYYDTINTECTKEISDNNTSSSFVSRLENTKGLHKDDFNINDDIIIYANKDTSPTTAIFRGIIEDITIEGKGENKSGDIIIISGRDYNARLQDIKIEPTVFNNTEISEIVTNIMSVVTDITTNNVQVTETIKTNISFNHISIFDALKQLANEIGWYFYIDTDKDLHFEPKNTIVSGILLDNTNILSSQFRTIDRDIYNNIWVYGSKVLTGWENTFTANGGSVYTLDYRPKNTNVFVGGSTSPMFGGIYNAQAGLTGSPIQYLVDYDQKNIVFVSGTDNNNIPASGADSIVIKYERNKQIVKYGVDRVSETNYGRKDKIIVDKNIITPIAALDKVKTELLEYSSPKIQCTIKITDIIDITPGNLLTVNLPNSNQDNVSYEILQVKYNFNTNNNLNNNVVTLKLNKRILEITDTIKQLMLDIRQLQGEDIFDSEELTRLEFAIGSIGLRVAEWNIKTGNVRDSFILGHPTNGILGLNVPINVGSLINTYSWESGVSGLDRGVGINLGSPNGYAICGSGISGTNYLANFTLCGWYKGDIPNCGSSTNGDSIGFYVSDENPCIKIRSGTSTGFRLAAQSSLGLLNSNSNYLDSVGSDTFNHFAYTYNGSYTALYFNGSLIGSNAETGDNTGYNDEIRIGRDDAGRYMWGVYDDIRLYKSGLTSSEIQQLYNGTNVTRGLYIHYKFDEGSGNRIYNSLSGTSDIQPFLGNRGDTKVTVRSGTYLDI